MGLPLGEVNPEADDAKTELYEGEDNQTCEFRILLQVAIKTYVRREADDEEVPVSVVWTAIEANPASNRLLNHLPRLLAQALLAQRARQEENDREERRQEILRAYYAREHLRCRQEEGDGDHSD